MVPTLTLDGAPVNVLVLWLLQGRILIKQVGNVRQVQLGVAADYVGCCNKLSAAKTGSLLQHALCSLYVLFLLQGAVRERLNSNIYGIYDASLIDNTVNLEGTFNQKRRTALSVDQVA